MEWNVLVIIPGSQTAERQNKTTFSNNTKLALGHRLGEKKTLVVTSDKNTGHEHAQEELQQYGR